MDLDNKLHELEIENKILKEKISKVEKYEDELQSLKIYVWARKKLLLFITASTVILTAFGIISIDNIKKLILEKIDKRGIDHITNKISNTFVEKNKEEITIKILEDMSSYIKGETDTKVKLELQERINKALLAMKKNKNIKFSEAIIQSYDNEKYIVITSSSTDSMELVQQLKKMNEKYGITFKKEFPNAYVRSPKNNNPYYGLTLDKTLSYQEAVQLREKAINLGLNPGTYIKEIEY